METNSETTPSAYRSSMSLPLHGLFVLVHAIAVLGIILIGYGVTVLFTGVTYRFSEQFAGAVGGIATLVGTTLTVLTIYLRPNRIPPTRFSRFVSAPLVLIAIGLTAALYATHRITLTSNIVNGFALLGISGGLFRMFSFRDPSSHRAASVCVSRPAPQRVPP